MKKIFFITILLISVNVAFGQVLPNYVPQNGLIAWYPFDGNANDISGNGYNGTVINAINTTDRFGNANAAYLFNSVDSAKITTSLLPPTGNAARTISCWFKYNALPSPCDLGLCIAGYGADSRDCSEANENFSMEVDFYVQPPAACVDGVCIKNEASNITDTLTNGWHFFAAVYDTSFGGFANVKIYLDCAYKVTTTTNYAGLTDVLTDTLSRFQIGAGHYDCPRYFDGKIDDIGVWNRALTTAELSALCNAPAASVENFSVIEASNIYPNPANDVLTVKADNSQYNTYTITNSIGKTEIEGSIQSTKTIIDIKRLPAGVYFVNMHGVNGIVAKRFVKM